MFCIYNFRSKYSSKILLQKRHCQE